MEEWFDAKESLPHIGQRVRALVVKELVYKGNTDGKGHEWTYDGEGEHGIYSWSPYIKAIDNGCKFSKTPSIPLS